MAPETDHSATAIPASERRVSPGPSSGPSGTHPVRTLDARSAWSVSGRTDERIAAIAARQRGYVSRGQLLEAGVRPGAIKRRVTRGSLHVIHPGVYAVGCEYPVERGRETAALLACREGTVLSHGTAAALWGIGPRQRTDAPIDVLSAGSRTSQPPGVIAHRTRHLLPRDVRIQHHLPVTSPARTLLDIAEILDLVALEWALDDALALPIVTAAQLRDVIDRLPSRPGAARLARLLDARRGAGVTRSKYERRFLTLIRAARLPNPNRNVTMHGYSVDFFWPDHAVAVEIDPYGTHSTKSAFERDRRKDTALRDAGVALGRFTGTQLDDEPFAVIASLARMLQRAARSS